MVRSSCYTLVLIDDGFRLRDVTHLPNHPTARTPVHRTRATPFIRDAGDDFNYFATAISSRLSRAAFFPRSIIVMVNFVRCRIVRPKTVGWKSRRTSLHRPRKKAFSSQKSKPIKLSSSFPRFHTLKYSLPFLVAAGPSAAPRFEKVEYARAIRCRSSRRLTSRIHPDLTAPLLHPLS